ncbi:hypothetical protein RHGRI_001107 [Rhododendron griersonianum]|uniref:DUF659 domain-containing protein n=1 Tax=Rhododendron griersonianum TaxID=479676 RepID=A0AAV6LJE8_9ERIC|nr:hypothetical protein RHGRI_001107 [Rhododendron griersonianum]
MSMDPTHIPSSEASNSAPLLKRNSVDVGWDYGVIVDPSNKDRLQCLLCGNQYTGGVSRMKRHIAQIRGDVASCTKASKEDILKCKKAIDDNAAKKKNKKKAAMEIREEVNIVGDESESDEIENVAVRSKKRPYVLGPMDRYTNTNPDSSDTSGFKKTRQPNINDAIWKEKSHKVSQYLARWVYEAGIPFHAIDNDSFKRFVEAVGLFGPGYQPPSQYQLREPLLKEEVERTKTFLKKQEEEWALTGCSIMTDAWTDRKRRSIMNLCVNYVIDGKAKGRLDSALHLTAYFLNPFYFFNNSTIQDDPIIMDGLLTCVEAFFPDDVNVQDEVINRELLKYKNKEGGFGRPLAAMGCATNNDSYDPGGDEEVDPVSGLTWEVIGEATGADEVLQPRRTTRNIGVRELHEEDFVSEDDTEEEVDEDFECESDGDEVMHGYGEEEDE